MKKIVPALLLTGLLMLSGCGKPFLPGASSSSAKPEEIPQTTAPAETVPPATVPADGNPDDVTCKGSYTGTPGSKIVATAGDAQLTEGQLQAWYWAAVAGYRQGNHEQAPDFSQSLDTQVCQIDSSVNSWQQYFLREALNAWHTAQALIQESRDVPLQTEEAYQPNLKNYDTYLTGMPATEYLYGYEAYYEPNSMHQAYLDEIPELLKAQAVLRGCADAAGMAQLAFGTTEEELTQFVRDFNYAYMYFTHRSHYIEPSEEVLDSYYSGNSAKFSQSGDYVDIRHILLLPVSDAEESWAVCENEANELIKQWNKEWRRSQYTFGELANKYSQDTGTALDGGAYHKLQKGQLMPVLDAWCFDAARQPGDMTVLRSDLGVHVLFFVERTPIARAQAKEEYIANAQKDMIENARLLYPMDVTYSDITLAEAEAAISADTLLYPDIAHERFPEIPLYLQQDYPKTMFGGYKITTNGCGITSLAMLASYMADDELTPPEMCDRYGKYSSNVGTDGMIFNYEASVLGFYLREKTYEPKVAREALDEGQVVISIQHPGYWTRGGHYIVCEKVTEDGLIQVRDSNIYNYGRVHAHKEDKHKWGNITANGSGFWIFEDKITSIPACSRCGTNEAVTDKLLTESYTCHKCETALLRRNTYLNFCTE